MFPSGDGKSMRQEGGSRWGRVARHGADGGGAGGMWFGSRGDIGRYRGARCSGLLAEGSRLRYWIAAWKCSCWRRETLRFEQARGRAAAAESRRHRRPRLHFSTHHFGSSLLHRSGGDVSSPTVPSCNFAKHIAFRLRRARLRDPTCGPSPSSNLDPRRQEHVWSSRHSPQLIHIPCPFSLQPLYLSHHAGHPVCPECQSKRPTL